MLLARMIMMVLVVLTVSSSCTKDEENKEEEEKEMKHFSDIIRAEDIAVLKKKGMQLYEGTNPPIINGVYKLAPWRLDFADPIKNKTIGDISESGVVLEVSEQTSGRSSVKVKSLYGYQEIHKKDPQSISGSGDNFTLTYTVWITTGPGSLWAYPFAVFISGTKDGEILKNIQMATVGLYREAPTDEYDFSVEGDVTIYSDVDGISKGVTP